MLDVFIKYTSPENLRTISSSLRFRATDKLASGLLNLCDTMGAEATLAQWDEFVHYLAKAFPELRQLQHLLHHQPRSAIGI